MKIRSQKDFWAGLMFIAFGMLAIVVSRDYPMGTAIRMGPGYFPTYLGAIMIVIGAITTGSAYRTEGEDIGRWGWRPLLWLSAAFAAFGLLIEGAGFVLALLALIVASSLAGRGYAADRAHRPGRRTDHRLGCTFHLRTRIAVPAFPLELTWTPLPVSFPTSIWASASRSRRRTSRIAS